MVQTENLRHEFAQRLIKSLNEAKYPVHGRGIKLARELGVSSKAVSKWLTGESMPRPAMMNDLAKILRADPLWLQHGELANKGEQRLLNTMLRGSFPLLNWMDVENWQQVDQDDFDKFKRFASGSIVDTNNAFWLVVKDDSMTSPVGLCVPVDSMILVDPDRLPEGGNLVIAKLQGSKEPTFKQLIIDEGTSKKYLRPLNTGYKPIEIDVHCIFIGVVIESRLNLIVPDPADVTFSD